MQTFRVLVVDDEEGIIKSYQSILAPKTHSSALDQKAAFLFDEEASSNILNEVDALLEEEGPIVMDEELEAPYYDVRTASQGKQAVDMITASITEEKPFSLIFLDIRMPPGIDGKETARQIRKLDPYVEIVIMTAYSDYSFEDIAKALGSEDRLLFFYKPFDPQQIQQLTLALTQKWFVGKNTRG